jgi:hypothetical protein
MLKQYAISPESLEILKSCVLKGQTYLTTNSVLVFACGARPNDSYPGGRDRIMDYAKIHLKKYNFFIAEKFFDLFQDGEGKDLLYLENQLAKYSDCIIIVLESESTFSELGAFAIKDDLAKIMLVINDKRFNTSKSFIKLGPLAKVDKISKFGPTIYTDIKSILSVAPSISSRLAKIEKKKISIIDIQTYDKFLKISPKIKIVFLLDIVSLFHPISHHELIFILKHIYGKSHSYEINVELGLLRALDLIEQIDGYYVRKLKDYVRFVRFYPINEVSLRSQIINHYHKYSKFRAEILRKKLEL